MEKLVAYLDQITENLKSLDPYRIVLFGSALGEAVDEPADIDLLVILDSDTISTSYEEKIENKLLVRRCIYQISKEIPVDLLVYTKAEYAIIKHNKNSFFNDIDIKGKVLYEKAS
jgi:predicted nucleotidyltransferase